MKAAARAWLAAAGGSLRVRLLLGTLVWVVATIVIAGWGLDSLFRKHVTAQFHAELKTHLDQLAGNLVIDAQGAPSLSAALSDPRLSRPYSGLYWQIDRTAAGGQPAAAAVLRSRSLWDGVLSTSTAVGADGQVPPQRVTGPDGKALGLVGRLVTFAEPADADATGWRLLVAADEQLMELPLQRLSSSLWFALGVLGLGLVVAAVVQVAVGLAPLRGLRRSLADVRTGHKHTLEGRFPAEVKPLVDELNTVLAQNTEIVLRARTQAGNLAHALKTPLAVMGNAAAAQTGELAQLVADQVELARRQVDYHLTRARAAGAVSVPGVHTGLKPVVEGLVRVMERVHAQRHLDWMTDPMADGLAFGGEEQDLQEMLGNLLDNAGKWARHQVCIRAGVDAQGVLITIDDDGPGIEPGRREGVFGRGVRDDEKVAGSGLGLAIVDDLARLYQGRVQLGQSPLGGLRVSLSLPRA